jgi:two-component system, LytTR family, sensor kinase
MSTRTVPIVIGSWLLVAVAFTIQQIATATVPSGIDQIISVIGSTLLFDLLWAAITFGIIAAVDRAPPGEVRYARFLGLHAALSVIAAIVQLFAYAQILAVFRSDATPFPRLVASNVSTGIFIYWLVLGVVLTVEQRRNSRERKREQELLKINLGETRAAMLRAQLQPHFLFNTLNAISSLIDEDPRVAERMVARLGDLLRLSLDSTRGALVTLGEELATLEAYLAIERLRLGARLNVICDIAPDAYAARVPDLLLQPLVENAIRHGLAPSPQGGCVVIAARRESDRLHVEVRDNGVGAAQSNIHEGIGLCNTRERLALISGGTNPNVLTIRTAPGDGFSVTISLPWIDK